MGNRAAPLLLVAVACGSGSSAGSAGGPGDSGGGDSTASVDGATDSGANDGSLPTEAGPGDSAAMDSPRGDAPTSDTGAGDGAVDAGSVYTDITDPANWEIARPGTAGTMGAAFDGRYVYYGPHNDMLAWRYDTEGAWDGGAWQAYYLPSASGTVFGDNNGKFVYFVPYASSAVRVDTSAFEDAGAWTSYDLTTTVPGAGGAWGGTFDGRWFYVGASAGSPAKSYVMRYDSSASNFDAWEAFDTSALSLGGDAGVSGLTSPGTDGKYVYYCGAAAGSGTIGGAVVARFDVTGTFTDPAAWQTYDVGVIKASLASCTGTIFDGRYLYFVPDNYSLAADTVARYDTMAPFAVASSWSFFDIYTLTTNSFRYMGGTFDGRYVYFVPFDTTLVVRVDTTAPFTTQSSWSMFDMGTVGGMGSAGAAFDGQYVYLAPYGTGNTAAYIRFKARTTPSTPPKLASGSL